MIKSDNELSEIQAYIERLQKMFCMMRKSEEARTQLLMSKSYLADIFLKETEIRAYLTSPGSFELVEMDTSTNEAA